MDQDAFKQVMEQQKAMAEELSTQAQTLKTLREAMGVDAAVSRSGAESYSNQTDIVIEDQEKTEQVNN